MSKAGGATGDSGARRGALECERVGRGKIHACYLLLNQQKNIIIGSNYINMGCTELSDSKKRVALVLCIPAY